MLPKIKLLLIIFFCLVNGSYAQLYKSHDWEQTPIYEKLSDDDKALASVAIKEKHLIQYYQTVFNSKIKLFETTHSIIRINTEKGIKKHNRVFIPTRNTVKVIDIKARVLTANGKITILNKKNIKELKNVKGYGNFKIFAIEGVTKDSQVEFIYTVEKQIRAVGSVVIQKDYKVKKAEVILRKPKSLLSQIKTYNNFPEFDVKVVEGNKKAYVSSIEEVPAMINEESATPDANRMKVSYVVRGSANVDMWNNLKDGLSKNFINLKSKKIKGLVSAYEKYKASQEQHQYDVNTISNFINNTFNIIRDNNSEFNDIDVILSKKQATSQSITKVYTALLNHYNINYELVLASDRYHHKFDKSFYSNFNLQELLIYFPEYDKYIVPSYVNSRLDYAPLEQINNTAVFIADDNYNFVDIKVPPTEYTKTYRDFYLKINTDDLFGVVKCKQKLTGYKASNMRGAYKYLIKEDYNRFKNITATNGIEDAEIENFNVSNEQIDLITDNVPFEIDWTYTSENMVEEAGNDLIFNIGKVIGTQMEFYQEIERVNPVEIRYLNAYNYLFKVVIPKGYKPIGLKDFIVDEKVIIDKEEACLFTSEYEIKDNHIIIKVSEVYNMLTMDLEYYEGYKKVINSAFDFSKKSILFQKI